MSYQLTPAQQKFAEAQVASGAYESTDKVVEAALGLLRDRQVEFERLATAIAQDERGEHIPFDMEKIKQAGRDALHARQSNGEC
ncbi:type II toxin-antitoxin system ParD family antitoxin [Blastopirellula sp. J2-11]|uniref:ribbon-helix-helix domain-containing protein n=1 Tax=Blastopirellula sp. J2-11 TaxID=2943192 RepID=UPI0021C87505|nr:type II toxin-antitoxin system ParD family antitoxin [Blastopirellula sp. J2-11]UUO06034.1 type II toxin-antitoxin system ParD family antitoxin [Blastopirellula sp. J2-11]